MSEKNESKDTIFDRNLLIRLRGALHEISEPWVMGILNLTPDSFYDGGRYDSLESALKRAGQMIEEGAKIIDVGASSSRPGAATLDASEEISRIRTILPELRKTYPETFISIDTYQSEVAKAAADMGADIINDISGGSLDTQMPSVVGELKLPYIMMHMRGTPANMKELTQYDNLFKDLVMFFSKQIKTFRDHGVHDLIIDPGFGFAKNLEQNYELLARLEDFRIFELPLLVGVSRKSMITKLLENTKEDALNGTTVLNTIALMKGANILRVHDVAEAVEAVKILTFMPKFT